jgi:hypothetical protein
MKYNKARRNDSMAYLATIAGPVAAKVAVLDQHSPASGVEELGPQSHVAENPARVL